MCLNYSQIKLLFFNSISKKNLSIEICNHKNNDDLKHFKIVNFLEINH